MAKFRVITYEGWAWPRGDRAMRLHYFETDGRSLCGNWNTEDIEKRDKPDPNAKCKVCLKRSGEE